MDVHVIANCRMCSIKSKLLSNDRSILAVLIKKSRRVRHHHARHVQWADAIQDEVRTYYNGLLQERLWYNLACELASVPPKRKHPQRSEGV